LSRRSLSELLRTAIPLRLAGPSGADPANESKALGFSDRSDYKSTWTALSTSQHDAAMWVAGYADEDQLKETGSHTVDVLRRTVGIEPTDRILEIGCGIGRVGKLLAPECAHWTGADISKNMLGVAAHRLDEFDNVDFVELSTVGLSELGDQTFDVVYCTVVFMHLLEWDRFTYVQEAFRVLRPGGRCFFDNVDITSSHAKSFFAEAASYPLDERPAQIGMVSSGDELRTYGEWAGFDSIEIHRWDDAWVGMTGTKPGAPAD
jgi:ubiquinone/menaquinone biosynthesis C-methylase UbiE